MSKLSAATAAFRAHPGPWAARQHAAGYTWQQVAQQLYVLTGVAVSAKTVRQWAEGSARDGGDG